MSVAKGLVALSVGAVGSIGTYTAVAHAAASRDPVTLANADQTERSKYASGTVGAAHPKYLVAAEGAENRSWWWTAHGRWSADSSREGFVPAAEFAKGKVSGREAFGAEEITQDPKPLNRVCQGLYKSQKTEIVGAEDAKTKRRDALWRYCSVLGESPKTIKDALGEAASTYAEGHLGKTKETELLSTKEGVNGRLWEMKGREFFREQENGPTEAAHVFFAAKRRKHISGDRSLRAICEEAYNLAAASTGSPSTEAQPLEAEVKKFCSLDGQ